MTKTDLKITICTLAVLTLAVFSYLIVSESKGIFIDLGKTKAEAWVFTSAMWLGALILAFHRPAGRYQKLRNLFLIIAIEAGMIAAAAIHVGAPLMENRLTGATLALAKSYESQIESKRAELARLADTARDFGKSNPVNLARTEKKRDAIRSEEAAITEKHQTLLASATISKTGLAAVGHLVFWRFIAWLVSLTLVSVLKEQLSSKTQIDEAEKHNGPAPISTPHSIDPQFDPPPGRKASNRSAVLSVFPQAECLSENGGKKGPFIVKNNGQILGRGKNAQKAWANAARITGRRAA